LIDFGECSFAFNLTYVKVPVFGFWKAEILLKTLKGLKILSPFKVFKREFPRNYGVGRRC